MRQALAATVVATFIGCGSSEVERASEPAQPVQVLDVFALTPVSADLDPFAGHRPAEVDCPPATWGPEGGSFEVQTGACNYAAFDQPLPMALKAGDELAITVWHDFLDAAEPATGHVAVWVGSTTVGSTTVGSTTIWETDVNVPTPSALLEAVVTLAATPPPSARLGLHLHNHGFNSWRFVSIELLSR